MAVVSNDYSIDRARLRKTDLHIDDGCFGIQRVPDHLLHGANRVTLPSKLPHVIVSSLHMDAPHGYRLSDRATGAHPSYGRCTRRSDRRDASHRC